MKKLILLAVITCILTGCSKKSTVNQPLDSPQPISMPIEAIQEDQNKLLITQDNQSVMMDLVYDYFGILKDVTGGNATGVAMASYQDNKYVLQVSFENLPELDDSQFFYEGWLIDLEQPSVISSGAIQEIDGKLFNLYSSNQDLTSYTNYVLTKEPTNDGPDGQSPDPAPAAHVLEGTMTN